MEYGSYAPGGGSPSGFRNADPQTREERAQGRAHHTEAQRATFASRGKGVACEHPLVGVKGSPQYIEEADRFNRDVAGIAYAEKQERLLKKEMMYEQKRVLAHEREANHWDNNVRKMECAEDRIAAMRSQGEGAKSNKSSEHYNIVNLDYMQTPGGQALKFKDEMVKYKSEVRAVNLYCKANTVSHDPITGAVRQPLMMPTPPPRPF